MIRPRRSLTLRLTAVSAVVLIAFTLFSGILYNLLMREETIAHYSKRLQQEAYMISQNLHDLLSPVGNDLLDETRLDVSWETLAPYLALTEQLTRSNVYLVDVRHQITGYFDGIIQTVSDILLPAYLEQSIALGFMGKTPFIRSGEGSSMHLTACAPVMDENSRVLGVVLMDTTLQELGFSQVSGRAMLAISFLIAFTLAISLAFILSMVFTRPIDRTRRAALSLSSGAYDTRLPVRGNDEVSQLASSMNILAERLEEARQHDLLLQKRQQAFFSTISHELRTPVTVIRGSVEALADGIIREPEEILRAYRQMLRETGWLQRLITDLLELSRLQDPDFLLDMHSLSLSVLLGDVAMSAGTLCARKGIHLKCEEPKAHPLFIGDEARLRQMLMAVVDNAVKFTPEGRSITLALNDQRITIRDEGSGIPPADVDHIFDRFYHTRSGNREGTGLGLALVREIARRHSIVIEIHSMPGRGTEFSFIFPVTSETAANDC